MSAGCFHPTWQILPSPVEDSGAVTPVKPRQDVVITFAVPAPIDTSIPISPIAPNPNQKFGPDKRAESVFRHMQAIQDPAACLPLTLMPRLLSASQLPRLPPIPMSLTPQLLPAPRLPHLPPIPLVSLMPWLLSVSQLPRLPPISAFLLPQSALIPLTLLVQISVQP